MTKLLKESGCTRIVAMDLHAAQIQGFTDVPFDNLYAFNVTFPYESTDVLLV
jgi:ribose-phosphate pyrophosphokinase